MYQHSHSHSHSHDQSHSHSHNHSHDDDGERDHEYDEHMNIGSEGEEEPDEEEIKHFKKVVDTFFNYREYSSDSVTHMEEYFNEKLTDRQKSLLPNYLNKLGALRQAATGNSNFLSKIGQECNQVFMSDKSTSPIPQVSQESKINNLPDPRNIDKVKSTLRQFAREWSVEGKRERDLTFLPILEELEKLYPEKESRSKIRVYCPGAGLGRLCLEVVSRGFSCQGIEFSYFMLLSSSFILNKTTKENEYTIYPFIHQSVNVLRDIDQLRNVKIPDVLPSNMIPNDENIEFSMVAGDFTKSIQEDYWDSVCTCFFIDTARNIVEYIECISKMLKVGGYWINFGPLLYHYADHKDSIELSYEQLRYVITNSGFEILSESLRETEYTSNKNSLMKVVYKCQFFVAIKRS